MTTAARLDVLKGCQNSSDGRAVCMMCVALNGYHKNECKYGWSTTNDSIFLHDEIYPVLYVDTQKENIFVKFKAMAMRILSKFSNGGYEITLKTVFALSVH